MQPGRRIAAPERLFDGSLRSPQVQEHECRDDRVERLVLERQCGRVAMHELDARDVGACMGEHRSEKSMPIGSAPRSAAFAAT